MLEPDINANEPEIACYQVSEDGVTWRAYDPARDDGQRLHKRIEFAAADETSRN